MSADSILSEMESSSGPPPPDGATATALGLLESRTLARGIEAADALSKEAPVALLAVRPVEPGRLVLLFTGTVDDVRQASRRARAVLADDLVDELLLSGPHAALIAALGGSVRGPCAVTGFLAGSRATVVGDPSSSAPSALEPEALGLVECSSIAATLLAADMALKEAHVRLSALRVGPDMNGKGLVAIQGEFSDVESSVGKAASAAEAREKLVRAVVIPGAVPGLLLGL
jgi:microcompartment protein CcmL/EutN